MKTLFEKPQGYIFLSANERSFLDHLIEKITFLYPFIERIYLYGSKARGDFIEGSDLDLLFITAHLLLRKERFEIYDLIFELELEYGVSASVVFVCSQDLIKNSSSFLREIEGEKVLLWSKD